MPSPRLHYLSLASIWKKEKNTAFAMCDNATGVRTVMPPVGETHYGIQLVCMQGIYIHWRHSSRVT